MKKFLIFSSLMVLPLGASYHLIKDSVKYHLFPEEINKDYTRHNSSQYGMKWGSRTDELVRVECLSLY